MVFFPITSDDSKRKYITIFWINFMVTMVFAFNWFYYFNSIYHGTPSFIVAEFGLPGWFDWLNVFIGWVAPLVFLSQTIHYYRIVKYGVKSTWKK